MRGRRLLHYDIREELGAGGMGVVYRAWDTRLDRDVALKVLPAELAADPERLGRFAREAKSLAALNHPNIVTVYSVEEAEGLNFLTMELVDGVSLATRVRPGGLELGQVLDIVGPLLDALVAAHERGVIHRDLKPANILLSTEGRLKVVDFGLAKLQRVEAQSNAGAVATETLTTRAGRVLGTVPYMSPEQIRGKPVSASSDLFSVGILLYEMSTGRRPFEGESAAEVMSAILRDAPRSVTELRPDLPRHLGRVIERCLEKEPARRYLSASDLRNELEDLRRDADSERARESAIEEPVTSVAVMPFADMSPHRDQQYFSEGLAEDLINALTQIKGLRVAGRTSAFSLKREGANIGTIRQELKVANVLDGSVQKAGNRLRITAQLINAADGYQLWSQRYDRELEDVFAIQDEITHAIASQLKGELLPDGKAPVVKRYTENLDAYRMYLKGRYFWEKRFKGGFKQAIEYFQQAIAFEPDHALAHAGLADCYSLLGWLVYLPSKEAFPKAKAAAERALKIDQGLAEAHASLGIATCLYDWDFGTSERALRHCIELKPSYAMAHWWYSFLLIVTRRAREGLNELQRAQELDPLSLVINSDAGWMLYFLRQHERAIDRCLKTLEMDPNYGNAHAFLGWAYEQMEMYEEAALAWRKAETLMGHPPVRLGLARTLALAGGQDEALKVLDEMSELSKEQYASPYYTAAVWVALEEEDRAFEYLKKAYEMRDCSLVLLAVDPKFDSLRFDPRFAVLLESVGLER